MAKCDKFSADSTHTHISVQQYHVIYHRWPLKHSFDRYMWEFNGWNTFYLFVSITPFMEHFWLLIKHLYASWLNSLWCEMHDIMHFCHKRKSPQQTRPNHSQRFKRRDNICKHIHSIESSIAWAMGIQTHSHSHSYIHNVWNFRKGEGDFFVLICISNGRARNGI